MIGVYQNRERSICIVVKEGRDLVHFIPMDAGGLSVVRKHKETFLESWEQIEYSVDKAAQCYLNSFLPKSETVETILKELIMSETEPKKPAAAKAKPRDVSAKEAGKNPTAAKAKPAKPVESKNEGTERKSLEKKAALKPAAAKPGRKTADYSGMTISLLKGHETKKFQAGSVRGSCFAKIKDKMTIPEYLKATKSICEETMAIDCLKKLSEPNQKQPVIKLA